MAIRVDFSQAAEAVPAGVYDLRVVDADYKEPEVTVDPVSGKTKYPYILWTYEVINHEKFSGFRFTEVTSLNPAAAWKLKALLKACGEEFDIDMREFDLEPQTYFGSVFSALLDIDDYNNMTRNIITRYNPDPDRIPPSLAGGGDRRSSVSEDTSNKGGRRERRSE